MVFFILLSKSAFSQSPVTALQHNGTSTMFYGTTSFTDAYNAAVNGDTLYLSVGGFTPPSVLAKGIIVVGANHFPDSATLKIRSTILGDLTINKGADNLHLEGIYINGNINYSQIDSINYVKVIRCRLSNANFNSNSTTGSKNNCSYEECFIEGSVNFSNYGNNLSVRHCLINNKIISVISNAIIEGNIFLGNNLDFGIFEHVNSSIIRNNIIIETTNYTFSSCSNIVTENNLFCYSLIEGGDITFQNSNNYFGVPQSSIFVNQTGNTLDYSQNYHLKNPSQYLGTDSTQVGIYGGILPFKDNGIPFTPAIISKSIASKTDSTGNLKINITVKAQDY